MSAVKVESEGEIDWVTLNRPERLNAINPAMASELFDYFSARTASSQCRVIILEGAGRNFCAGLDLRDFDPNMDVELLPNTLRKMRSCPQPIIALIRGAACGGGFSLALAGDVRLAGTSAKMNVAYVKLGLSGCELGTSYFIPRTVGPSVANELMLTGRFIHADRALATGLVSAVMPDSELGHAARTLAGEMLSASRIGLQKTKETVNRVAQVADLDSALRLEGEAQRACMSDPAFAERVAAFSKSA